MKKLTNQDLARWEELQAIVKGATAELESLKAAAKAQGASVINTKDFTVTISENSRTGLVGLEKVAAVVGLKILQDNHLINHSVVQNVKLTRKTSIDLNIVKNTEQSQPVVH